MMTNLSHRTFSKAVLFVGLSLLTACASTPAPTTFDLSAAKLQSVSNKSLRQLAINEPVTVQALDSDRIIIKDTAGSISFLPNGQWADRLPRLVQARVIQTFENASYIGRVNRPGDRIVSDHQLNIEIRDFQIDSGTGEAVVSLSVKLINDRTGRVMSARLFSARVPASAIEAATAAPALDQALSQVMSEIVRWVR